MGALGMAVALIVIIFLAIIIQYLLNPYWHKLGLPRDLDKKDREERKEREKDISKEEKEFYQEIWDAKKKKS